MIQNSFQNLGFFLRGKIIIQIDIFQKKNSFSMKTMFNFHDLQNVYVGLKTKIYGGHSFKLFKQRFLLLPRSEGEGV